MSTYKEQDAENLLAHLREGIDPDSVSALLDDTRVDCEGTGEDESVWMHLVLPGARYGKDDRVIYDPYETFSGRSLKSSGGLPMVEFYLHRGDDRPDAARNIKDMEPLPYLIGRYYMKTLLADHRGFGILLQDTPHLGLPADTVLDVQDALAETVRAYAAGCDFEIDTADADIARCLERDRPFLLLHHLGCRRPAPRHQRGHVEFRRKRIRPVRSMPRALGHPEECPVEPRRGPHRGQGLGPLR